LYGGSNLIALFNSVSVYTISLASNLQTSMAMIMMGSDVKMRAINQATKMKRLKELKKVRTKMGTKTEEMMGEKNNLMVDKVKTARGLRHRSLPA
jgi:hypothetical protein